VSYGRILEYLAVVGSASAAEVAESLGLDAKHAVADMGRLNRPSRGGKVPRRVHISAWTWEHPGSRRYPRPVYSLGDRRDAPKPALTREQQLERHRRYYHDRAGRTITSVWDLALTTRERGLSGSRT
jgi:hypothetical protein